MSVHAPAGWEMSRRALEEHGVRKGPLSHEQMQGWGGWAKGPMQILPQAPEMPMSWRSFILTSLLLEEQMVSPTASGNRPDEGRAFGTRVSQLFGNSASVPHTVHLNPDQHIMGLRCFQSPTSTLSAQEFKPDTAWPASACQI